MVQVKKDHGQKLDRTGEMEKVGGFKTRTYGNT